MRATTLNGATTFVPRTLWTIIIRHDGDGREGESVSLASTFQLFKSSPSVPETQSSPLASDARRYSRFQRSQFIQSYFPRPLEVFLTGRAPPSRCWRRVHVETLRPRCPDVGATFSSLSCDDDHDDHDGWLVRRRGQVSGGSQPRPRSSIRPKTRSVMRDIPHFCIRSISPQPHYRPTHVHSFISPPIDAYPTPSPA